nr:odorant receptor 33 [Graphosoma rubrolineatum]
MWLLDLFSTGPPRDDKGMCYEQSRMFRHGIAVSKKRFRFALPLPLAMLMVFSVLSGIVVDTIINIDTIDWATKVGDFCLRCNGLGHCIAAYLWTDEIDRLSDAVDVWVSYRLLEEEGEKLKKESKHWMDSFNYYFSNFMNFGQLSLILLPFTKLLGGADFSDLYIFKMWSPLPTEKWWATLIVYFYQICTNMINFVIYEGLTAYVMSVSVTIGHQVRLIGLSYTTIQERAMELASMRQEKKTDPARWHEIYCTELNRELSFSAKNYQHLYRNAQEMCRIFSGLVDLVFYSGMSMVIMFGLKIATEKENKIIVISTTLFVCVVVSNQYLFTIINDSIADEVTALQFAIYNSPWHQLPPRCLKTIHIMQTMVRKMPTLSNIMGHHVDREMFLKVINATYCYISTLLSMDL